MNRYRQARIRAGYSQKEASISLGVSSPSMSDWENGKTKPTSKHLYEMAKLYGTTTDYLIGDDQDDSPEAFVGEDELKIWLINRIKRMKFKELVKVSLFLKGMQVGIELHSEKNED